MFDGADTPHLDHLVARLIERWPDHGDYVAKSLAGRAPEVVSASDALARVILLLGERAAAGVEGLIDDYRFLCEKIVLPEELHFRRHGRYRLAKFEDAERECYANPLLMGRYMNGLLVSEAVWSNHAHVFAEYLNDYLPRLASGASHLEIGPGHGVFLYFAATKPGVGRVEGWDISPTSIAKTRDALQALGATGNVELRLTDLFAAGAAGGARFDSIVMSEILEHLEDPVAAVRAACRHLKPGGLLWVNVPANSPAPDHIFLFEGLEHAKGIVEQGGLAIEHSVAFPMTGATLEKAVRRKLAVSCVVLGRKPGGPPDSTLGNH